jgi:hypothetical protein
VKNFAPDQINAKAWPNAMIVNPAGSRTGDFSVYHIAHLAPWETGRAGPKEGPVSEARAVITVMTPYPRVPRIESDPARPSRNAQIESITIDPRRLLQASPIKVHVRCPEVAAIELPCLFYEEVSE